MLNEFYEFIAKKVNSFFQKAASDGTLLKGESFCLKLDNDDMVAKVSSALKHLAEENKIIGIYELVCRDNSVYKTYTLKVKNDEVIIAAQIDGMTNDFLCATLRNAATIYKPYHLPFNPLALTKSSVFKPLLPMHTANAFKDTLSKAFNLGPKQQNTLLQCILETYRASGIMPANPDTWDEPAPTLYQVYQRYMNDEEIKKGDSLSAALDTLMMFEVFEANPNNTKTLFEILNGVVVIDLSSYDENIQSLVVAITLDLFYSQMQALGSSKMEGNYRQLTKMILVDEADNFMSRDFPSLKKILKEGREFGVGTILSTQSLKHFGSGDDDYAKYILTWVVHNVSDLKNSDIDFVFKTESKSQESSALFNAIKTLEKHHSVVKIGNDKPVYMKDKAFWQLYKELY